MIFSPLPDHICHARARDAVKLLGGDWQGDKGRAPAPGKGQRNRSLVVFPNPHVRYGVGLHDHAGSGSELVVREDIASRLGWDKSDCRVYGHGSTNPTLYRQSYLGVADVRNADENAKTQERCKALWAQTLPLSAPESEPGRAYLLGSRGLSASCLNNDVTPTLRCHPGLPFWAADGVSADGSTHYHVLFNSPAMVARITDPTGKSIGLHQTWLTTEGRKHTKAGANVRKMKGQAKGGAVALAGPDAHGLIAVAEGIESALSLTDLIGLPCQAALSATGLSGWTPPMGTRAVLIAHDDDANGVGREAGLTLARRLAAQGIESRLYPPVAAHKAFAGCNDWNDALLGQREGGQS